MLTVRSQVVEWVYELAKTANAFDELERRVMKFNEDSLVEALLECGVIPEAFDHDSSEEKLWAKYCDILLAMALTSLGLKATVIRARGNSADVLASDTGYSVVGDAKAFRLSRTAKNQKDFKVKALNDWRRENTYACLVGPLTQFPNTRSQIYDQAVEMNVTLFSYTHLRFLIQHIKAGMHELWAIGSSLPRTGSAIEYWTAVDSIVAALCDTTIKDLELAKHIEIAKLKELGEEGISYWEGRIQQYKALTQEEAVNKLVCAEKIQAKIRTIKKAISWETV